MRKRVLAAFVIFAAALAREGLSVAAAQSVSVHAGKAYRAIIVIDTLTPKMAELRDGLTGRLADALSAAGATVSFEQHVTGLKPASAAAIAERIRAAKPDVVFTINNPTGFADLNVAARLRGSGIRFVSENAVPLETGVIASRERPGGDVTGVGVFVQLESSLRLLKRVKPDVKRVYSYSWDAVAPLNAWWDGELRKACKAVGFEYAGMDVLKSIQAELARCDVYSADPGGAVMACISPYVNDDGSLADPAKTYPIYAQYLQGRLAVPYLSYEDTTVRIGALMGACVVWKDLGAQMADMGLRILSGEAPGSIPWESPRKFNIVVNKATADRLGIRIPPEILPAAYRVYTDYSGNFLGKAA